MAPLWAFSRRGEGQGRGGDGRPHVDTEETPHYVTDEDAAHPRHIWWMLVFRS